MKKQGISLMLVLLMTYSIAQQKIHFNVNMTSATEVGLFSPKNHDSLFIFSSFNNWSGKDYPLTDADKNGIFEGTYELSGDSGVVYEYKFVIQKKNGQLLWEKKPNPQNRSNGNRELTIGNKHTNPGNISFDFDKYYLASIGKKVIFTVKEMQEDFNVFRETLENEHCCIYEYTGKEEFDKLFAHQYDLINQPLQPHEYYKILTPLTHKIGCGHTAVWMPGGYWDIDPGNLFPLRVKLIEGYAVVSGAYSDTLQLPVGSIIQEINGRDMNDILNEMRENYSADAFNIHFINAQIERRFSLIFARRFGFPEEYIVKYAFPKRKTSKTCTLIPATNQSVRRAVYANFKHPPLTFQLIEENRIAVLTIPTFIYYDKTDYFTDFIDSCFTVIQKKRINHLILDVRGNDGGDPFCAAPLFSYLQPKPLPYFSEPYGKYSTFANPLPLPKNHFEGSLITLMDGRCFSTNGHFCSLLKYHHIGTFVGTESGSSYCCNAGKNTVKILKNTGIQLYFGRSSFAVAVSGMDKSKPLKPDYYTPTTYADFINGKDAAMKKAISIIQNSYE